MVPYIWIVDIDNYFVAVSLFYKSYTVKHRNPDLDKPDQKVLGPENFRKFVLVTYNNV